MNEEGRSPALIVESPGLLTTVQDLGRFGYARFGVPSAGALDEGALRRANLLVGNAPGAAALEITLLGPTLTLVGDRPIVAALTGADHSATLDGAPIAPWRSFRWQPGARLALGGCQVGARAYLAIAGGIAVPTALGSRSTDLLGRLGGLDGRALRAGDHLPLDVPAQLPPLLSLPDQEIPQYQQGYVVRVILGPQEDRVTPDALATFLGEPYTVGNASDRIGARLDGPALAFRADGPGADILSEGIATGAIQVPANGQPIVLLAGHQTTGGYSKVATVIAADLWRFGQARPGTEIRFRSITPAEAREALVAHRAAIDPDRLLPIETGTTPMAEGTDNHSAYTIASEITAPATTAWSPAALESLLSRAAATGVTDFSFEAAGVRLHIRRVGDSQAAHDDTPNTAERTVSQTNVAPQLEPETSADDTEGTITAPVLGIFYRAAKPDQPPLVEVGDQIAAGQPIGLIEVMKTFHEVTAEGSARITAALVENGAAVQYGQPLFAIKRVDPETAEAETGAD